MKKVKSIVREGDVDSLVKTFKGVFNGKIDIRIALDRSEKFDFYLSRLPLIVGWTMLLTSWVLLSWHFTILGHLSNPLDLLVVTLISFMGAVGLGVISGLVVGIFFAAALLFSRRLECWEAITNFFDFSEKLREELSLPEDYFLEKRTYLVSFSKMADIRLVSFARDFLTKESDMRTAAALGRDCDAVVQLGSMASEAKRKFMESHEFFSKYLLADPNISEYYNRAKRKEEEAHRSHVM